MKRLFGLGILVLAIGAVTWAAVGMKITVNGKPVEGEVLKVGEKLYVPVSALKAGGVSVSVIQGVMALKFGATGGTSQQNAVEGKVGEWLFNGIWRLQVKSLERLTEAVTPGWKVTVEIRNGSKFNGYSPGGTGWQGATLVLADGNAIASRSDSPELRDTGLNQGAGTTQTLYFETDSTSKPDKFILRFDPKGLEGTPLKFSVADPSFRVFLHD